MNKRTVVAAAIVLFAGSVSAQNLGERTGVNSLLGISPTTADFVKEVAESDMFEIRASELASMKMQGAVKDFASHMIVDHTKTTEALRGLASAANASLPIEMASSQESMLDKLKELDGDEFRKQYISDQESAHKSAVSLFERYGKGGDNATLKAWAVETLPALQQHLDMVTALNK
jgi:putative membrane protein